MEELISPAVVIDVSSKAANFDNYQVSLEDVIDWEKKYGKIPDKAMVCMRSGWSKFWDNEKKYQNIGPNKSMNFPGFSKAAAEFITNERNINGVGS